jgi:drug/metabolite transporter (DMT)-like permease
MFIKVALHDFSEGAIVCLRTALGAALLLSFAAHRGAMLFGLDLSGSGSELVGGGMMLAAALGYAISWMLVKHKLAGAAPEAVAGGTMVIAAIATAPLLVAAPPASGPSLDALASLLALGAGGTGIAFVLYYTLIAEVGPRRASMVGCIAPAFSIVYGVVLLGEHLRVAAVGGLALILAGSWLGAPAAAS